MSLDSTTSLYDNIGQGYDTTRRADSYITSRLAQHLSIVNDGMYLDVACGTGNYTMTLASQGGRWHGIDQSGHMLQIAKQKSKTITWHQADVTAQPFSDGMFMGALCTLAIHHFGDLLKVFKEIYRVIAHGRIVIFTATPEQMYGYWLNEYFPHAMAKSIEQMPALDRVQKNLIEAGFQLILVEPYEIQMDLQDFFLYSGKFSPEIYLSESVRRGISTFTSLANAEEIKAGCKRLSADISSCRIADVMETYKHDKGDYLFVVAGKGA